MRISFGKGWGCSYKRPDVTRCPCWLEVLFRPQRWQQFDKIMYGGNVIRYHSKVLGLDIPTPVTSTVAALQPASYGDQMANPKHMCFDKVAKAPLIVEAVTSSLVGSKRKWANDFEYHRVKCRLTMHTVQGTLVRLIRSLLEHSSSLVGLTNRWSC